MILAFGSGDLGLIADLGTLHLATPTRPPESVYCILVKKQIYWQVEIWIWAHYKYYVSLIVCRLHACMERLCKSITQPCKKAKVIQGAVVTRIAEQTLSVLIND